MPAGLLLALGALGMILFVMLFLATLIEDGITDGKTIAFFVLSLFFGTMFTTGIYAYHQPYCVSQIIIAEIKEVSLVDKKYQMIIYDEDNELKDINLTQQQKVWFETKKVKITKYNQWFGCILLQRANKVEPYQENK